MNVSEGHAAINVIVEIVKVKVWPHCIDRVTWKVVTLNDGRGGSGGRALSDEMELLEAVILNCWRVGDFRIMFRAIKTVSELEL
jgi:hypothetical protein